MSPLVFSWTEPTLNVKLLPLFSSCYVLYYNRYCSFTIFVYPFPFSLLHDKTYATFPFETPPLEIGLNFVSLWYIYRLLFLFSIPKNYTDFLRSVCNSDLDALHFDLTYELIEFEVFTKTIKLCS